MEMHQCYSVLSVTEHNCGIQFGLELFWLAHLFFVLVESVVLNLRACCLGYVDTMVTAAGGVLVIASMAAADLQQVQLLAGTASPASRDGLPRNSATLLQPLRQPKPSWLLSYCAAKSVVVKW
jgi:hypothetical protein